MEFYYICRYYFGNMIHLVKSNCMAESGNEYSDDTWRCMRKLSNHVVYTRGSGASNLTNPTTT